MTALRPALERRRGAWVGWDGGISSLSRRVAGLDVDLVPVPLSRREIADYYHGFSNRTLWPLLHGWVELPVFDRSWWRAYHEVNARFAAAEAPRGAIHWVHDYHLMLLPGLLRTRYPDAPIGYFLHTPFASSELWRRLPWRAQLIEGLLGADVVAFHTKEYRDHFLRSCWRSRDDVVVEGTTVVAPRRSHRPRRGAPDLDRRRRLRGADVGRGRRALLRPLRAQFAGRRRAARRRPPRLHEGDPRAAPAVELLLERRKDCHGTLTFVQIAVPSRGEVREYAALRRQVEELVGRINGRFSEADGRSRPLPLPQRPARPARSPTTGSPTSCSSRRCATG